MKPNDIALLTSLGSPALDPVTPRAVVAVTRPDAGADANVGQLWSVPLDGGPARRLTRGFRDTSPRFSPDGSLLAFLRAEAGRPPQLHVVDARGGEPVAVTEQKLGVSAFAWSPDGARLAFVARVPEHGRYGSVEGLAANAEPPRRFTTLKYSANGVGITTDRRSQLFVVDVPDVSAEPLYPLYPSTEPAEQPGAVPAPRQLTDGPYEHRAPVFSPDGTRIAVVAARHETRDHDLRSDVWAVPVDGGKPQLLTPGEGAAVNAADFTPAGDLVTLASRIGEGRDFVAHNSALVLHPADGAAPVTLTDPITTGLVPTEGIPSLGEGFVVLAENRGRVELRVVSRDGSSETLPPADAEVTAVEVLGTSVVAVAGTADRFSELYRVTGDTASRITDFGSGLAERGILPGVETTIEGRDGYPVHGWVFTPEGEGPHPVLLSIHGGPYAQYTVTLFDEFQVYADAGYAVVACNPRGASGYGEEHGRTIRQRMGTVDLHDVLDFLDGAIAQNPSFDADRVGILGGSYGGYLTAWTIAHDHRFAAAIVERGFLDPDGFVGTSDIGSFFGDEYVGTDPELVRSQSPQAVVDQVRTPTLVMHSTDDLRCPLPQAERYYAALKRNGAEAELLVFPGEDHELSRSGRPRHRIQRFDAILEWFSRYLPTDRNPRR
ncbi:S9 family peptidase [Herbiconiux sp. SYSU D00978]|uniref:S9 family peptidase n=1 Tax=Herbiconiux sp. SYSU D00978 TaxID=2812562 RepID=UPI001A9574DC|nr:S9 family peptidase [Herbiconiux sp. SYSU D00978]